MECDGWMITKFNLYVFKARLTLFSKDKISLEEPISQWCLTCFQYSAYKHGHLGFSQMKHMFYNHLVHKLYKVTKPPDRTK